MAETIETLHKAEEDACFTRKKKSKARKKKAKTAVNGSEDGAEGITNGDVNAENARDDPDNEIQPVREGGADGNRGLLPSLIENFEEEYEVSESNFAASASSALNSYFI
mmetsp:Transcript_6527/g.15830  ORF Transcript_6527/g.15830 Transcript_6527/m.15830 type:complete len:109 (+) Transcript_6527:373-699(+)